VINTPIFACKKIDKENLLRCSLGLNKMEYKVFVFLFANDRWFKVSSIARHMNLDRTSIQKAVKKLVAKSLVVRIQKNIVKGGYVYFYRANQKDMIKSNILRIIHEWCESVVKEIERM